MKRKPKIDDYTDKEWQAMSEEQQDALIDGDLVAKITASVVYFTLYPIYYIGYTIRNLLGYDE